MILLFVPTSMALFINGTHKRPEPFRSVASHPVLYAQNFNCEGRESCRDIIACEPDYKIAEVSADCDSECMVGNVSITKGTTKISPKGNAINFGCSQTGRDCKVQGLIICKK